MPNPILTTAKAPASNKITRAIPKGTRPNRTQDTELKHPLIQRHKQRVDNPKDDHHKQDNRL